MDWMKRSTQKPEAKVKVKISWHSITLIQVNRTCSASVNGTDIKFKKVNVLKNQRYKL